MKAREIMTSNPEVLTAEDTVQRAAQLMRDNDTGFIPVVDDRNGMRLRGVITDRDIAIRHVAEGHTSDCPVGKEMSGNRIRAVSPDDDVEHVMREMREAQIRRIPVVEGDRLVGVIAQADLATRNVNAREVEETLERVSEPSPSRR